MLDIKISTMQCKAEIRGKNIIANSPMSPEVDIANLLSDFGSEE
jgi:hypothetical protein